VLTAQHLESGSAARLLPVQPPELPKRRSERSPAIETVRDYAHVIRSLLALNHIEGRRETLPIDAIPAKLALRAKTTNAKRADGVVLHQQIAGELRKAKPKDAKPTDRVLRRIPSMKVLRADLKAAGIPDEPEAGRVDLHAMRMSLATFLAANGVPQRVAQAHMRHSDPRLTSGVYTDETLLRTAAAIAELPPLPTKPVRRPERLRATGTCDVAAQTGETPVSPGIADDGGPRAAPAQRAAHTRELSGASGCAEAACGGSSAGVAQLHEKTATCAAVHRQSQKRVMGLEPTTFTLANHARPA
jgi:hypothetical protein